MWAYISDISKEIKMHISDKKVNTSILDDQERMRLSTINIEVEQALIGAILLHNDSFYKVNDFLKPIHFSEEIHRRIYDVISETIQKGQVANPILVKTYLGDHKIGSLSTTEYIAHLAVSASSIINVPDYGRLIYDLFIKRQLINIGKEIISKIYDSSIRSSPHENIEEAERDLYRLAEGSNQSKSFQSLSIAIDESTASAANAYKRGDGLCGMPSGFPSLDVKIGGLQQSDLIIIAGRPGMGKTAFATNMMLNISRNAPEKEKKHIGFFSLEMSSEQLATRMISDQCQISSSNIKKGDFTQEEYRKIHDASKMIKAFPIYIDQTGGLSISQLVTRARRLKRQSGLDLLIIDYIQLLSGSGKKGMDGRVNEISEITAGLKSLAKELNIPIIALSQLSRQVESRDDKRPLLSDLRDSGSIEQDADVVMFVYREAYYLRKKSKISGMSGYEAAEFIRSKEKQAEIIIAKNRHGAIDELEMGFEPHLTKFYDIG